MFINSLAHSFTHSLTRTHTHTHTQTCSLFFAAVDFGDILSSGEESPEEGALHSTRLSSRSGPAAIDAETVKYSTFCKEFGAAQSGGSRAHPPPTMIFNRCAALSPVLSPSPRALTHRFSSKIYAKSRIFSFLVSCLSYFRHFHLLYSPNHSPSPIYSRTPLQASQKPTRFYQKGRPE